MTKVKLLRDLDGKPAGAFADYPESDAKRLKARGSVEIVADAKAAPAAKAIAGAPENKAAAPKKGSR
jgi:hypothetical protein